MRRYTFIRQIESTDCGVAALAMISMYYGHEITLTKLRDICGTTVEGTSIGGLVKGAEKLGFTSRPIRISDNDFLDGNYTMPAIVHVLVDGRLPHYMVLTKIENNYVHVLDPAEGKRKIPKDEFLKDFDNIMILLKPTENFVASMIDSKSSLSKIVSMLMVHKKLFITAIAIGLILTLLGIVSSFFTKILIDEIIPNYLKDQLSVLCLIFLGVSLISVALSAVRQHMVLYLSQKIGIPMMIGYYSHIFNLPMKFFGSRKTGDIITRFQDTGTIISIASSIIMTVAVDIVFAILSGVVLFTINGSMFLITVAFLTVDFILVYFFKQPYKEINRQSMIASASLNSTVIDSLKGIAAVKSNAAENMTMENIEDKYIETLRIGFKANLLSNYQGTFASTISAFSGMFMMWFGAGLVIAGEITLGTLMAFSALSGYFTGPVSNLVGLQYQFQEADIALKRLNELFQVEEEKQMFNGKKIADSLYGDIEVHNLHFKYGTGKEVLNGIDINIPKGSRIAIVGESGCGKSTLCNILSGLWVPDDGNIVINGNSLNDLDIYDYRKRIAYIQQNVGLFSGTIRDNILIANQSTSEDDIERACSEAGCNLFLNRMPQGLDTYLEEAGNNLSGGEKQRLAFARAFIKNPELIILDEATSGLDFMAEKEMYDRVFNNQTDCTVVIIAHRLSTIQRCDKIFVLNRGIVEAQGTHNELIAMPGLYRSMWETQSGTFVLPDIKREKMIPEDDDIEYC